VEALDVQARDGDVGQPRVVLLDLQTYRAAFWYGSVERDFEVDGDALASGDDDGERLDGGQVDAEGARAARAEANLQLMNLCEIMMDRTVFGGLQDLFYFSLGHVCNVGQIKLRHFLINSARYEHFPDILPEYVVSGSVLRNARVLLGELRHELVESCQAV